MNRELPALNDMTREELVMMMVACAMSVDPTDVKFSAACCEEIKRRTNDAPSGDEQ